MPSSIINIKITLISNLTVLVDVTSKHNFIIQAETLERVFNRTYTTKSGSKVDFSLWISKFLRYPICCVVYDCFFCFGFSSAFA